MHFHYIVEQITMNTKIYFAGSIRGGRIDADLYRRIIEYMQQTDTVLTEHIGRPDQNLLEQGKRDMDIYSQDSLHFWRNGKVVYEISLWLDSDNEKGVRVYSKNDFIVRDRNNAKLHLEKDGRFYIIRDLSEWNTDSKH